MCSRLEPTHERQVARATARPGPKERRTTRPDQARLLQDRQDGKRRSGLQSQRSPDGVRPPALAPAELVSRRPAPDGPGTVLHPAGPNGEGAKRSTEAQKDAIKSWQLFTGYRTRMIKDRFYSIKSIKANVVPLMEYCSLIICNQAKIFM